LLKTGNLRRSLQVKSQTKDSVVITADTTLVGSEFNYAEFHNEGAEITVTAKMQSFFWAKYYEIAGKSQKTKKGERRQSQGNTPSNEKIASDAQIWKNLALKKVGSKLSIPKRQFIGESEELKNLLEDELNGFINSKL
jgi:phage gpG-like protein